MERFAGDVGRHSLQVNGAGPRVLLNSAGWGGVLSLWEFQEPLPSSFQRIRTRGTQG